MNALFNKSSKFLDIQKTQKRTFLVFQQEITWKTNIELLFPLCLHPVFL